jgi:hypothetical protein
MNIHKKVISSAAVFLMSSAAAMAGMDPGQPLGGTQPQLGDPSTGMGADLSLPALAVIAVISLVAGIRYIRNKRS